jgi:voltage-gated potassium channel
MNIKSRKRLLFYFSTVIFIGSFGFYILEENWTILESVYMTIITLSTVGFGETHPLSDWGKIWAIGVILFGVSGVAYMFSEFSEEFFRMDFYRRNKMIKKIKKLENHYIICGYGRMGAVIAGELQEMNFPFVVIDNNPEEIKNIEEKEYLYIEGDATLETTLIAAGVERAKGIVVALNTDPDNLFVSMSVRTLNNDVFLVSRCSANDTASKLKRAGVDKIVNPYIAGGHRMSELLISPQLEDSVTISTALDRGVDFGIDEIKISDLTQYDGIAIGDTQLQNEYGLLIVGVTDKDGHTQVNPGAKHILHRDQTIMVIGTKEKLKRLTQPQ